MEENRRKLTLLALAGIMVLVEMIGYPILKTKLREYRQQDISLSREETYGLVEEMEREEAVSIFIGWVTETGVPYDRYKPVYEDMEFYPIWQELQGEDGDVEENEIP